MRAACTRCGNSNWANSAKAREKVAASGKLPEQIKAAQALETAILLQTIDQRFGGGKVEHSLGDKGTRQGGTVSLWPPRHAAKIGEMPFHAGDFKRADQLLQLRGEGLAQLTLNLWKQTVQYSKPDLR